jgi:hypothetical protein
VNVNHTSFTMLAQTGGSPVVSLVASSFENVWHEAAGAGFVPRTTGIGLAHVSFEGGVRPAVTLT